MLINTYNVTDLTLNHTTAIHIKQVHVFKHDKCIFTKSPSFKARTTTNGSLTLADSLSVSIAYIMWMFVRRSDPGFQRCAILVLEADEGESASGVLCSLCDMEEL